MIAWKCRLTARTPRRRNVLAALALSGLALAAAAAPAGDKDVILPPDAAARAYEAGRALVRRGLYTEGIKRLDEAVATGHTKPEEHLGTSRNFVDRYDPDYWLGVAYMELGDTAKAREHLLRSRSGRLIEGWPEASDLNARLLRLDGVAAASRPTAPPAPAPPEPAPTTAPSPAPPTATPASAPPPVESPAPAAPVPVGTAPPREEVARAAIDPRPLARLTVDPKILESLIAAISAGNWISAESSLGEARTRTPDAPELALLDAVVSGTRYLLEGRKDARLLARSRKSLADYRKGGGSRRAEEIWISPALAEALR